jgi:peptide chain release factor 2
MGAEGFWDKQEAANKVVTEVSRLKGSIQPLIKFSARTEDLGTLMELVEDAEGEEAEGYLAEIRETLGSLRKELDELEIASFLSGKMDKNNAILSINAGAGGTESCDWADMLYRMYVRWAERNGFEVETDDLAPGEEAGISHATIRIMGPNAYGYSKAERGVHRLVRISPFDSNARRHTSFCAIDVIAEVDDDIDIEIKDEDLRVDTYRASGKGGQHVNKTDSAVRITHLPTNIVVQCQNERSQHKNRATAMKMLKSKLYEKYEDDKRTEMEKFYGEKGEIGWGNQIRSYVFQPYQMVKDLRTGVETSNIQQVMDGDLSRFIHSWLRAGCPTSRNKEIKIED